MRQYRANELTRSDGIDSVEVSSVNPPKIIVITNWFEELKERMPAE
jgi:hypothetical protein